MQVLLLAVSLLLGEAVNAAEPLILCVHPYLPATEIVRKFTPLADYLGEKIGIPVTVEVSKDYQEHINKIGMDRVDISYMGPASYVKMVRAYGSRPLLARLEINGKPTFQGVIIVRKDSPLRTLEELSGKRFAFGDPNSTMSHLVPRFMLLKAGVGIDKLAGYAFLKNHHNVALGVLVEDFDAGAVKEEVFYAYRSRGLKELARTPEISEHVFVASAKLSPRIIEEMRKALYDLGNDKRGAAVMSAIKDSMTALVPVVDKDYDNLRMILKELDKIGIRQ